MLRRRRRCANCTWCGEVLHFCCARLYNKLIYSAARAPEALERERKTVCDAQPLRAVYTTSASAIHDFSFSHFKVKYLHTAARWWKIKVYCRHSITFEMRALEKFLNSCVEKHYCYYCVSALKQIKRNGILNTTSFDVSNRYSIYYIVCNTKALWIETSGITFNHPDCALDIA